MPTTPGVWTQSRAVSAVSAMQTMWLGRFVHPCFLLSGAWGRRTPAAGASATPLFREKRVAAGLW